MKGHKRAKGSNKQNFFTKAINRAQTIFSDNEFTHKAQTVGAYSAAFLAAFLVALVSASTFTPVDNSEASENISVIQNTTGYYLNMTTSGNVSMEIDATPDGAVAVTKDTVNVKTNSPAYKIYVSMNSSTANSNKLYLNGSTSATSYFAPVNGSTESPVALTNNSWGWALANSSISGYAFDNSYTVGSNVSSAQKFAAMPLSGDEALIASGTAATTSGTDYDVYYGAKANTALKAGTYSNTVLYTAIGEASSSSSGEASIVPEIQTTLSPDTSETYGKGQQVTIATSMYTSDNLDLGTVTAKIGGKECTNVETSFGAGGLVNITCNAPESLTWGTYDVVATFTKFDRAYTIDGGYNIYIPYDEMEDAAAGTYTMQQFTRKTCDEMETPKAYNTQDGTGSILNGDTINTDVPEVTLKDARNTSHEYRVRKLADGNCWMADNLRLALSTSTPLTSETSDINYDMDTGHGVDGSTTTPRVISNNLQGTVDPLGTYSTDPSTGVISWTPFADSQTTDKISWGSPYADASGARATSGESINSDSTHFGMDGATIMTESSSYYVQNNRFAEYIRSFDNGTGTKADGDGNTQYYGTYYNWYAATAGSGTWALTSGGTKNSVCPKNWNLPKNDSDGSWYDLLYTKYSFTAIGTATGAPTEAAALLKAPFSIIRSGYYYWSHGSVGGRNASRTDNADYWSSYANLSQKAFAFTSYNASFTPQNANGLKTYGFPIRCVIR